MNIFYKIIIFVLILFILYIYFGKKNKYECLGYNITQEKMDYLKENSPYVYNLLKSKYDFENSISAGNEIYSYEKINTDNIKCKIEEINDNNDNNEVQEQNSFENSESNEIPPLIPNIETIPEYEFGNEEDEEQGEDKKKKWKMEERCRKIFQDIYKEKFPKCNPEFLKNPETKRKLELDGYCENKKLAFEYQGYQHYIFPNRWHRSLEDFNKGLRRDQFKFDRCNAYGVYLITIPYNVPENSLKEFIIWFLPENANKRVELEKKNKIPHYAKCFYNG